MPARCRRPAACSEVWVRKLPDSLFLAVMPALASLLALALAAGAWEDPGRRLEQALGLLGLSPGEVRAEFGTRKGEPLDSAVARTLALGAELDRCRRTEEFLRLGTEWLGIAPDSLPGPGLLTDPALREARDRLEAALPGTGVALEQLARAGELLRQAHRALTPAEWSELLGLARGFEPQLDQWPDFPLERMAVLASRLDFGKLISALLLTGRAAGRLDSCLAGLPAEAVLTPFRLETPLGPVVLAGPGTDTCRLLPLLLIDPDGDDCYLLPPWSTERAVSLILDRRGDDRYLAPRGGGPGAALGGIAYLLDLAGDDLYRAGGRWTLGAGGLGAGVLEDRSGDDDYQGAELCQGASLFGVGLLLDRAGNDHYRAGFGAQGAAFGPGLALLVELAGADHYQTGGLHRDRREPDAFKSLAQGAAVGLRPFASGGAALLYDRAGGDDYQADCFAQGVGYWGGRALLADAAGDDHYRAGRYAQGCGLHSAQGALLDRDGSDRYELASGVGQGAGEDRALGLLLELAGDDHYGPSGWMCRGAGGAGGVGLLLELEGADRYGPALKAADGCGVRWQELGGLGFLFDCEGADRYADTVAQGFVRRAGEWGAALDLPLEQP